MAEPLKLASSDGAKASNLALALVSLPADRRRDALTFYAFCREVDDIADDEGRAPGEKLALLQAWEHALSEDQSALPAAMRDLITRRGLDTATLTEIVRGMEMDIEPRMYPDYPSLQEYCWRVAGAVGLVSATIFGCQRAESRVYAEELGYALQLTNILRDVAVDARLGRVYIPQDDLARFGVTAESLLQEKPTGDFTELMKTLARRARQHYASAAAALHPADAGALVAADIMRRTYEKLLGRMEQDGFRVFARSYRLAKWEKLLILSAGCVRNAFAKILPGAGARG